MVMTAEERLASNRASKKKWRLANREKMNANKMEWVRRRYEFLANYKLERGCEICGYSEHACALDLDHIDDSKKSRGKSNNRKSTTPWTSMSQERVEAELLNCRVLCANCHRVETNRKGQHLHNGESDG